MPNFDDDQEVSDLESNLLQGNEPESPTEAPAEDSEGVAELPDLGGGEEGEAPVEGDEGFKEIQKLTGELTQKVREKGEEITDENAKYIINSMLSAINLDRISDDAKQSFKARIDAKGGEESEAPEMAQQQVPTEPEEQPMTEYDDPIDDLDDDMEDDGIGGLLNDAIVSHIIQMANLTDEKRTSPKELAFDFCEAAYIYIIDMNEDNKFINKLKSILKDNNFRPASGLNTEFDLTDYGKQLYDAMYFHEKRHGGKLFF